MVKYAGIKHLDRGETMEHNFEIKNFTDERAYHNTAIMIYLKAAYSVLGDVTVRIGNSLNQGYFSSIGAKRQITSGDVRKIESKMKEYIKADLPIASNLVTLKEAQEMWEKVGCKEKASLLDCGDPNELIEIDDLDGYVNCMYTSLLPSCGYINLFEVRPYRNGLLLRLPTALSPNLIPEYRDDNMLYEAFAENNRMRKLTGIHYLSDINEKIRKGETQSLIDMSETYQMSMISMFAGQVLDRDLKVVLIAGPSSSGKTTFAKRLCKEIGDRSGLEPLYLGTDDYFVERDQTPLDDDGKPNFEGLEALDLDLFNEQMRALVAGEEVDIPEFDFKEGKKVFGKRITKLDAKQILLIEGIHSLNDVLTEKIPKSWKYKIYISPLIQIGMDRHNRVSTTDGRLLRRMVRDNQFREYDARKTLEMWHKVRAGESVYVFPYNSAGDVIFNSCTLYDTNLLRTYAEPLLLDIKEDEPQYAEAQRILNFMRFFEKMESADGIPQDSIIREFIGQ